MATATVTKKKDITKLQAEIKKLKAALHLERERFFTVVERNPDGIIIMSRQGIIRYANPAALELFGRDLGSLLGEEFDTPVKGDYAKEIKVLNPNRGEIFAEMRVTGTEWEGKKAYAVSLRDITERKKVEEALRESEVKYRNLFGTLQEGIWVIDRDSNTTLANQHMADMLGYTVEEMQGRHLFSFMDERGVEIAKRLLERRAQGIKEQHDFEFLKKDGSRLYAMLEAGPLQDEAGNYAGAIAGVIDVTQRKQAEEVLQESEEKFRSFFELTADLVCIADINGYFRELNMAWEKALGYSKEELLGKPFIDFVHPEDKDKMLQVINNKLEKGATVFSFENRYMRKDGGVVWLEWTSKPMVAEARTFAIARDITERKRVESGLARIASFPERNPAPIVEVDAKGSVYYMNPAARRLLPGLKEKKFHHAWLSGLRTEFGRFRNSASDTKMREVVCDDSVFQQNLLYVRKEKRIRIYGTDITERKRAEEELRESEQRLSETLKFNKSILRTSSIGILTYDAVGQCVFANEAAAVITGTDVASLLSQNFHQIQSWKNAGMYEAALRALDTDLEQHTEAHVVTTFGKDIWLDLKYSSFHSKGKKHLLLFTYDITDRKRAEAALQALTSRNEAILAAVPDIIMEVDVNKVYTWANEAGYQFFGDDVKGKEAADYFEGEQKTYSIVSPLFKGREDIIIYVESWQRRRDGKKRLLAWWCRVLKDSDGRVTGALSTARDITERKQAEEELLKLKNELEERVKERTAQLQISNKELESFSYSVSHDLRAPLRAIDGFSLALLEDYQDKLEDQAKDYLTRIRKGTANMAELIDDMLLLSRVTRSQIDIEEVNLSSLVMDIESKLKQSEKQRRVEFLVQEGVKASVDRSLISIVIENLIGNAWKFTRNTPKAKIEFGILKEKKRRTYFVRDNGAGFDMKYVDKLFTPFQRLHRIDEFEGTGIGLATAKRIIRRHQGDVWIEGKIGEGATVYFTLP